MTYTTPAMTRPQFVLRFDDIAPAMAWSRFAPIDRLARELGIPLLLGVVPDCRDPKLAVEPARPDFWDQVRSWRDAGWCIAQHGYTHQYTTREPGLVSANRRSEFAGLDYDTQHAMLKAGKDILVAEGVWQPVFMAPAHSFDMNTVRALAALGFEYLTDGYGMYPYRIGQLVAVPQLFASPRHAGFGVYTLCQHVNHLSEQQLLRLQALMRAQAPRFVSLARAAELRCPVPLAAAACRAATTIVLRQVRLMRAA
jgi:predicted deacetylase